MKLRTPRRRTCPICKRRFAQRDTAMDLCSRCLRKMVKEIFQVLR